MKHLQPLTHRPAGAQGRIDLLETAVLLLVQAFFQEWDNFSPVIQNLRKYYSKTP